ncbi:MAG: mannitol dehydrogenase family protein [Solirubrobacteraceae bacterium]
MSAARLSRGAGHGRAAAPVRLVHLGLGNFSRAHPCWYTEHAPEAEGWGIAAFAGRGGELAEQLNGQQGLYTLITRAGEGDRFEIVSCLSRAHVATDHDAWLGYFASPELSAVTVTVTEAGYMSRTGGGLDSGRLEVQRDLEALRRDRTTLVRTAPARLVAGIAARRQADAGPLALVPCDNMADNGAIAERVVHDLAGLLEPELVAWMRDSVAVVTTMVDRITPRTQPDDVRTVREATGRDDRCPVVTEPYREWVLCGAFPAARPRWEHAGATFTDDVTPFERRKLWLLNGGHSLLAYAGSIRGHETVAEAVADDTCRAWLEQWWSEASRHLDQPADEIAAYRAALLERFSNPRMNHRLDQIAADGSQKLPIRIVPILRAERDEGRMPAGAIRVLTAWVCHLRGDGAKVVDAHADEFLPLAAGPLGEAVRRVLDTLAPALGADAEVVASVVDQSDQFARYSGRSRQAAPRR